MAPKHRHAATKTDRRGRAVHWARLTLDVLAELWSDRVARVCGITALLALYLTATLTEPWFLALFASALAALRYRSTHRPVDASDDEDDWF